MRYTHREITKSIRVNCFHLEDQMPRVLRALVLLYIVGVATLGSPPVMRAQEAAGQDPPPGFPGVNGRPDDPGSLTTQRPDKVQHPTAKDQKPSQFAGDPIYVDSPDIYIGRGPFASSYVPWSSIPATGCNNPPYATSVIPLGIAAVGGGQYLAYGGQPGTRIFPIGVSPDNGCGLYLDDVNVCSQERDWKAVLASLGAVPAPPGAGLNKLRLWVAFGSANDGRNTPFEYHTDAASCPAGLAPCFRLDILDTKLDATHTTNFFKRIRDVVNEARTHHMFVEITFFSPFNGDNNSPTFANGPWGGRGAISDAGTLRGIKFTGVNNFVLDAQTADNLKMQDYQRAVVVQTVKELWCFDNVWWEIANEPERSNLSAARVANWEKLMIASAVAEDTTANHPLLVRPHLIAVNVSSRTNTTEFIGPNNPNVAILEGHYSEILPPGNLDSGAITFMARDNGGGGKVLGFNESKITASLPAQGDSYTRSLTNGSLAFHGPEPSRAEAWEFMLSRGGTVDLFGYLSGGNPGTVGPIAGQMASLKAFMATVPFGQMTVSTNPPSWVGLAAHPDPANGSVPPWDATRHSFQYWGALQTPDGTASPNRSYALYLHHSAPRCKEKGSPVPVTYDLATNPTCVNPGNLGWLVFGGYDARIWTSNKYQDSLTLTNLGASGTFRLCWVDPATFPAPTSVLLQQTCHWNGTSCDIAVKAPPFSYDIALKMDENISSPCTQ